MSPHTAADAPLPDVPSATAAFREVNGVRLHVVAAGDRSDPLVVLLHGFPEFWYGWRDYVAPLVDAGYRVLVPDQRGYNRSDKPDGVGPYRRATLARDVVGLVRSEGRDAADVVGHDWGGVVGWDLALRHPDAVDRLAVVNAPHPAAFRRTLRSNPTQLRKSRYLLLFQPPRLPEWAARRRGFERWTTMLREEAGPGAFTDADLDRYRTAWTREGAVTAMIDWYRATLRRPDFPPRERVERPTMVVWGENDRALVPELAPRSLDYCADGRLERFPDAAHFVTHERPERVAGLLVDHLDG